MYPHDLEFVAWLGELRTSPRGATFVLAATVALALLLGAAVRPSFSVQLVHMVQCLPCARTGSSISLLNR